MNGTSPRPVGIHSIPLAVAYAAVPLGTATSRYIGGSVLVSSVLPWLLLACVGTIVSMRRPSPGAPKRKGFFFNVVLFFLIAAVSFIYSSDIIRLLSAVLPYLSESTPLVFLLLSLLWGATCGVPDRADFQRFGAFLGVLCLGDFFVELAMYHVIPTVRWIGNVDVLAGLLLVSLCASLKPGDNQGGVSEPDQGRTIWRILIMLGLLSCLSRTALFAAAWVVVCFGRGRFGSRLIYSLSCVAALVITFFLPYLPSDAIRFTDYWLWVEAVRLFTDNPMLLLTGFPVDVPLPVVFPIGMSAIWEAATGVSASTGAFLPQVPSFWLRIVMAWGMAAPVFLLTGLFILLVRRLTRLGAGLTAALFAQGMTTPLLYDPAMAVPICLAFVLAVSTTGGRGNVKFSRPPEATADSTSAAESDDAVEVESDPTRELDLRPL